MKERRLKHSVLKKLLVYPILLLVPVNILLVVLSVLQFSNNTRESLGAIENGLNIVTAQIGRDVSAVNQYLNLYVSEDVGFIRFSESEKADLSDEVFYKDYMSNLKTLSQMSNLYSCISAVYMKFRCMDTFCSRGNEGYRSVQLLKTYDLEDIPEYTQKYYILADKQAVLYVWSVWGTFVGYRYELSDYISDLRKKYPMIESIEIENLSNGMKDSEDKQWQNICLESNVLSLGIKLKVNVPKSRLMQQLSPVVYVLLVFAVIFIAAAPILSLYYYRQIFIPMKELRKTMHEIRHGRGGYRAHVAGMSETNEFVEFAEYFNGMINELQQAKVDVYEMKLHEKEMQLNYYSQQIRPHFILNALNRIYTHEATDWNYVRDEIMCLSRYFRYVVNVKKKFMLLSEEMKFIQNYLEIQKMLVGDYFYFMVSWEKTLDKEIVPPLIVVSFVENCIKYALNAEKMCCIAVTAEKKDHLLKICVRDSGRGFSDRILDAIENYMKCGQESEPLGVGIINTLQRLQMLYAGRASVNFRNDNGAVVELWLPLPDQTEDRDEKSIIGG